jgi:Protein of unknown function (DUF3551)
MMMRAPVWAVLITATFFVAAPVRAQTYDPSNPVCMQTYGIFGDSIECNFTSLAQCAPSARGRAAQCIVNPYFRVRAAPRYSQHRRVYQ